MTVTQETRAKLRAASLQAWAWRKRKKKVLAFKKELNSKSKKKH
jgi:hypothetical protein